MLTDAYGPVAYAYDEATGKASAARLAEFIPRVLARYRGGRRGHLDLACGTGLAAPLFQRLGYRSVGVDLSLPMLRQARGRVAKCVAGDLRALPIRGRFGRITLFGDAVCSLRKRSDLVRCFRGIRRCMGPESLLLFDVSTLRTLARWPKKPLMRTRGRSHSLTIRPAYSRLRRLVTLHFEGWAQEGAERYAVDETHYLRGYTKREILRSLADASLRAVDVIDFRRFPDNDAMLFVVAAC